jgi:hypothetical protein
MRSRTVVVMAAVAALACCAALVSPMEASGSSGGGLTNAGLAKVKALVIEARARENGALAIVPSTSANAQLKRSIRDLRKAENDLHGFTGFGPVEDLLTAAVNDDAQAMRLNNGAGTGQDAKNSLNDGIAKSTAALNLLRSPLEVCDFGYSANVGLRIGEKNAATGVGEATLAVLDLQAQRQEFVFDATQGALRFTSVDFPVPPGVLVGQYDVLLTNDKGQSQEVLRTWTTAPKPAITCPLP